MNQTLFIERYQRFLEQQEAIQLSINTVLTFEEWLGKDIEQSSIEDIRRYMTHLIDTNANKYNNVIHIARYYYYVDMKEHYIHMTKYFNSLGVLEHIVDRITRYEGEQIKDAIVSELELPPFGTDMDQLPDYTKRFMEVMNKHTSQESCNHILAGNNHRLPESSVQEEKQLYQDADSLEAYLVDRHKRKVQELTTYYENNQVWFEQIITPDVIEFVKQNQEILSGVLQDDKLYITKIPYDINQYVKTEDDLLKRYHACHCSFVKEGIKAGDSDIPKEWCYCSAGFAKFPFETILGQELPVTLLETPLDGDPICRFEIDLSNIDYKK